MMVYVLSIGDIVQNIVDFFRTLINSVTAFFGKIGNLISQAEDVASKVSDAIKMVKDTINPWLDVIKSVLPDNIVTWVIVAVTVVLVIALWETFF